MPVWQEAMAVAEEVFRLSESFPKKEDYGLTSQLRRAALSISANITEAYGREHTSDKISFYYYSGGSVTETRNHVEYARRVGYVAEENADALDGRLQSIYGDLNKIVASLK